MDELFASAGTPRPAFAMLAPDLDACGCRYALYACGGVDPALCRALDALLARNPQYAYCRRLGQLLPPRVARVHGYGYAAYAARLARAGQRLGDIKATALSPLDGWTAALTEPHDVR